MIAVESIVAGGKEIRVKQLSAEICDLFEALLDAHGIKLPDKDREGNEAEACIYGDTYRNLEDAVTDALAKFAEIVRKNPNKALNTESY